MAITLAQICDAVKTTLGAATGIAKSQSYSELTEGIEDLPLLQVYPQAGETDIAGSGDRTTFRAGVRQAEVLIHCDVLCRQRSHIDEDMAKTVEMVEAVQVVLEAQDVKPYFGLAGIKGYHWRWERVIFPYAGVEYFGARFFLTVRVF